MRSPAFAIESWKLSCSFVAVCGTRTSMLKKDLRQAPEGELRAAALNPPGIRKHTAKVQGSTLPHVALLAVSRLRSMKQVFWLSVASSGPSTRTRNVAYVARTTRSLANLQDFVMVGIEAASKAW